VLLIRVRPNEHVTQGGHAIRGLCVAARQSVVVREDRRPCLWFIQGGEMLSVGMAINHAKISIFFPSVWLLGIAVCSCTGSVRWCVELSLHNRASLLTLTRAANSGSAQGGVRAA
jgi:hypothetical protein